MLKAAREAKTSTNWTDPDPEFEEALRKDIEALLAPTGPRDSTTTWIGLPPGSVGRGCGTRSRARCSSWPLGVPDIYQGDELWSFALVDQTTAARSI
jgi:(1->4)-alpha-D-glucan 1-alpha-D-glucosylmutase